MYLKRKMNEIKEDLFLYVEMECKVVNSMERNGRTTKCLASILHLIYFLKLLKSFTIAKESYCPRYKSFKRFQRKSPLTTVDKIKWTYLASNKKLIRLRTRDLNFIEQVDKI